MVSQEVTGKEIGGEEENTVTAADMVIKVTFKYIRCAVC